MKEPLTCLLFGVGIGIAIGYMKEDEIHDLSYKGRRLKKQMKRRIHTMQDYLD